MNQSDPKTRVTETCELSEEKVRDNKAHQQSPKSAIPYPKPNTGLKIDNSAALRFNHISEENRGLLVDWLI